MLKKLIAFVLLFCYTLLWSGVSQAVALEMTSSDHAVHLSSEFGKQQIILHKGEDDHHVAHGVEAHNAHFDADVYDHPDHSLPDIQHEDSLSTWSLVDGDVDLDIDMGNIERINNPTVTTAMQLIFAQLPQPPPFLYLSATTTLRRTLVIHVWFIFRTNLMVYRLQSMVLVFIVENRYVF